jgi:hypothetical protein
MRVKNISSNMTEVDAKNHTVLVSYETPVACYDKTAATYYRTTTKFSVTTSKHINKWLDGVKAEEMPQTYFDGLL